jgi:hypothetical protein
MVSPRLTSWAPMSSSTVGPSAASRAGPTVAPDGVAEPGQVLDGQRLVQAELRAQRGGGLLGVVVAEQREELVSLEQAHQQEAEHGGEDQHHDHLNQPVDDPTGHVSRFYWRMRSWRRTR